jgi:protein TonB
MAYADQTMSGNRVIALIIVALIHIVVGYALVTGLAHSAIKQVVERVTTVDIEEPEPEPEEEPPPPPPEPDTAPPPPVAPPAPISIATSPPPIRTQPTIPPPAPIATRVPPPAPPAPPPPRFQPKDPEPRGNPGNWATANDYPRRALREEREGTTRFRVTVNTEGRVTDCQITSSSGHPDLDEATCQNITRRARFRPATDGENQPTTGSYSNSVRWVIPEG